MNRLFVLDFLHGIGLCLAGGDEVEGCLLTEVFEVIAGTPAHVDGLDVLCGEYVGGDGSLRGEFGVEAAQRAEAHLVAAKQKLADTAGRVFEDTLDGARGERAVVFGDVLHELVEVEHLAHLCGAVGLRLGDVLFLCSGLGAHDGDSVVNHSFLDPLPNPLPLGRGNCFAGSWAVWLVIVVSFEVLPLKGVGGLLFRYPTKRASWPL